MPISFCDSHCHLTSEALYPQAEALLQRASEANVRTLVNICTNPEELQRGFSLSSKHSGLYQAAATTPHDVDKQGERDFHFFRQQAELGKLVAIGETGLDYHYLHSDPANQKKYFIEYLRLGLKQQLPIIIHCREAFKDLFDILDAEYFNYKPKSAIILHCFTGTLNEALEGLNRGCFISFSGIVTFKKSEALREIAKEIPLERLLIETDSPYLAPQTRRGEVNEPSFLPEVAAKVAEIKGLTLEELAEGLKKNISQIFKV